MRGVLWSVLGIVLCGGIGGAVGVVGARALDLSGLPAALVAAGIGMVLAVVSWAALTTLLRTMGLLR